MGALRFAITNTKETLATLKSTNTTTYFLNQHLLSMSQRKSAVRAASGGAKTRRRATNVAQIGPQFGAGPQFNAWGTSKQPKTAQTKQPALDAPPFALVVADPKAGPLVGKPDGNSQPTNVVRVKDVINVAIPATGELVHVITPNLFNAYGTPNAAVALGAAVAGYTYTNVADFTAINTEFYEYRLLSYSVDVTYTGAPMTCTGRLALTLNASNGPLTPISAQFDDDGITCALVDGASCIVRPIQDMPFVSTSSGLGPYFHSTIVSIVGGLPSTPTNLMISVNRVIEAIPYATSMYRNTATHTVCDPHSCCTASNIVGASSSHASGPGAYTKLVKHSKLLASAAAKAYASLTPAARAAAFKTLQSLIAG